MKKKIELLSPARDVDCGMEALRHGADAVYIGGPAFGARAQAGNSVADIGRLCEFAHVFDAHVYVALNTILNDDELTAAERLATELYRAGADALIVQDAALLQLSLPPIALHASTQMDICNAEKARFLEAAGFSQIVLARELSLNDISGIRAAVSVPLEAFVHGALCVSYSGRCYASQYCFKRSANRGNCAQFCRLAFDLIDAEGRTLAKNRHLLSLRDMNRSSSLEEMMDAGVSSFKIEGRLKDVAYVKNVTAFYRQAIDKILERRATDYERASHGTSAFTFSPQPEKSFNRGFTEYFLHGRTNDIHSFDTPKAKGEAIGKATKVGTESFAVQQGSAAFSNGDGLCFVDAEGQLQGFRLNKVENGRLYPARMPRGLKEGTQLYRNYDHAFDALLSKPSAVRRLRTSIALRETGTGYALDMSDETGRCVCLHFAATKEVARSPQRENIVKQLAKLGETPFEASSVKVETAGERFIPSSTLAEWRRRGAEALLSAHRSTYRRALRRMSAPAFQYPFKTVDYTANICNRLAAAFYRDHGVTDMEPAFERHAPATPVLMFCRHCLRHALGRCPRQGGSLPPWKEPLSLRLPDGRSFPLRFDCKNCQMLVYAPR